MPLAAVALAALACGARAAPPSPAARFAARIDAVYTQSSSREMLEEKGDGYRFETFDPAAGYARVVGPFDGRSDFFWKRAPGAESLIEVDYSCGPACTQKAAAYRFDAAGRPTRLGLAAWLSLPAFSELRRRLLTLCTDAAGDFDTERDARAAAARDLPPCPFALSLPKRGGAGTLFEVSDDDGSGYALSVAKTRVTPRASLLWRGGTWTAVPGSAADAAARLVNGAAMDELF